MPVIALPDATRRSEPFIADVRFQRRPPTATPPATDITRRHPLFKWRWRTTCIAWRHVAHSLPRRCPRIVQVPRMLPQGRGTCVGFWHGWSTRRCLTSIAASSVYGDSTGIRCATYRGRGRGMLLVGSRQRVHDGVRAVRRSCCAKEEEWSVRAPWS